MEVRLTTALLALLLSACAGLPQSGPELTRLSAERGLSLPRPDEPAVFVQQKLVQPLSADDAVQLALINNPDVRVAAARLGLAAAEVYEAGRLANPQLSVASLSGEPQSQLTLGIALRFVDLLSLPAQQRQARQQHQAALLDVSAAAFDLAGRVQSAWFEAAAAEQRAQVLELAERAARNAADIAQRYFDAGNINRHALSSEQAAASGARLDALNARSAAMRARLHLHRLMGLAPQQSDWTMQKLPQQLPPQQAVETLLPMALASRLDVAAAQQRAAALASRYRLQRRTRWVAGLELGVQRQREYDGSIHSGPSLSFELPLFDWGRGRVARAQAELEMAESVLDAQVLDLQRDVGDAAQRLQLAQAMLTTYREQLVPQREQVVLQLQRELNFMLAGVFELLQARREEYQAYAGAIEALRDGWMAQADLTRAVGRVLPSTAAALSTPAGSPSMPPAAKPATEPLPAHSPSSSHSHSKQAVEAPPAAAPVPGDADGNRESQGPVHNHGEH